MLKKLKIIAAKGWRKIRPKPRYRGRDPNDPGRQTQIAEKKQKVRVAGKIIRADGTEELIGDTDLWHS